MHIAIDCTVVQFTQFEFATGCVILTVMVAHCSSRTARWLLLPIWCNLLSRLSNVMLHEHHEEQDFSHSEQGFPLKIQNGLENTLQEKSWEASNGANLSASITLCYCRSIIIVFVPTYKDLLAQMITNHGFPYGIFLQNTLRTGLKWATWPRSFFIRKGWAILHFTKNTNS